MTESVARERFDEAYAGGTAPWVIGEPQPAVVALERDGLIRGRVLDAGCGTGEHTILLTELGYDVLGIDFSPGAVELARRNAEHRGVAARFEVADALAPGGEPRFDTVLDSALFHVFDDADRVRYLRALHGICLPGAVLHVLALSDVEPGIGPRISEATVRAPFGDGWELADLRTGRYRGMVRPEEGRRLGLPADEPADFLAWLARGERR
ncbi:MAG TPA: class I SAM-dependent methyltransferase [Pseudonocardia sp.]|jgi:SAM-dependent methyltransferase